MLGDTVRTTRIRRGLTQAKLARLAGVSRRHLAALEKEANVSIAVLRKVANVLELNEIDLGARGDPPHPIDIEDGDLLVTENRPKGRAASGELVIAKIGNLAYVGRWWQKHGRRAVVTNPMTEGTTDKRLKVMAAVNVV